MFSMLTIVLIQISCNQRLNIWATLIIYIFKYFELQIEMALENIFQREKQTI